MVSEELRRYFSRMGKKGIRIARENMARKGLRWKSYNYEETRWLKWYEEHDFTRKELRETTARIKWRNRKDEKLVKLDNWEGEKARARLGMRKKMIEILVKKYGQDWRI